MSEGLADTDTGDGGWQGGGWSKPHRLVPSPCDIATQSAGLEAGILEDAMSIHPILDTLVALRATRVGSERVIAPQLDALIGATREGGVAGFRAWRAAHPPRDAVHGGQIVWGILRDLSLASLTAEEVAADGRQGLRPGEIGHGVAVVRALWALQQEDPRSELDWRVEAEWDFPTPVRARLVAAGAVLVGARR